MSTNSITLRFKFNTFEQAERFNAAYQEIMQPPENISVTVDTIEQADRLNAAYHRIMDPNLGVTDVMVKNAVNAALVDMMKTGSLEPNPGVTEVMVKSAVDAALLDMIKAGSLSYVPPVSPPPAVVSGEVSKQQTDPEQLMVDSPGQAVKTTKRCSKRKRTSVQA